MSSATSTKKLTQARPLFDPEILRRALKDCVIKLNPVTLAKNPVIFVVEVGALVTTIFLVRDLFANAANTGFSRYRSRCGSGLL